MINEENNAELKPPEPQGSDEPASDEAVVEEPGLEEAGVEEPALENADSANLAQSDHEPTGPGQLLNRKREALGMSVQQVAEELHITMHYVRALEDNAHDKLPGDVFIRGYIRSYASLLKLDPVVIVNVYNEFTNQQASAAEEADSDRSRRRNDKNLPWIIVSGIAFVAIAFALWYFNTRTPNTSTSAGQGDLNPTSARVVVPAPALSDGTTPTIENVATTLPMAIVASGTDMAADAILAVASVGDSAASAPSAIMQQTFLAQTTLQENSSVEARAEDLPSESDEIFTGAENGSAAESLTAQEVTPGTVSAIVPQSESYPVDAEQGPVPENRVISLDAGGDDLVQIKFNGESMVQVEDRSDKQIYRDILTSGDVLRITGSAPFNILLGDAAATELSLNGSNIDFTSNIRIDNSVRLTIGL